MSDIFDFGSPWQHRDPDTPLAAQRLNEREQMIADEFNAQRAASLAVETRVGTLEGLLSVENLDGIRLGNYCVGDGVADDTAGFTTAIGLLTADKKLYGHGRTYKITAALPPLLAVAHDGVVFDGVRIAAGDHTVITVNADRVRFLENCSFSRGNTAGTTTQTRAGVVVNGKRFRSRADYDGALQACLLLTNGACDGALIDGGKYTPRGTFQDAGAIVAQGGASLNKHIHVRDVEVDGTNGKGQSIVLFDAYASRIEDCNVHDIHELDRLSYVSSGWTLVSGNIYSRTDRTDGSTRVLLNGASFLTEQTSTPTTPGTNQWGISGGTLYVNLGGTDPNTVTIESRIVSGYGPTVYQTGGGEVAYNVIAHNHVENTAGFGVYYAAGLNVLARGNKTLKNTLKNCMSAGQQDQNLPSAGLACNGGQEYVLEGDTVITSGYSGVHVTSASTGTCLGVTVLSSTREGFLHKSTGMWKYRGCTARANGTHGFNVTTSASQSYSVEYEGCESTGNTNRGLLADRTTGTYLSIKVRGGYYATNGNEGIRGINVSDSFIGGGVEVASNGTGNQQVQLSGTLTRCVVDDLDISAGTLGLSLPAGQDVILGKYRDATGTPYAATVVAAATVSLPPGDVITVTGNTAITSINPTYKGHVVTLIFTGTPTLTDGAGTLRLGANFVATADDAISLACDGTNWYASGPGSAN